MSYRGKATWPPEPMFNCQWHPDRGATKYPKDDKGRRVPACDECALDMQYDPELAARFTEPGNWR